MNERLELISPTEVRISLNASGSKCYALIEDSRIRFCWLRQVEPGFDRDGLLAERDAINCYLDSGSFAALADTSAVPWIGAKRRILVDGILTIVNISSRCGNTELWRCEVGVYCWQLRPEHIFPLVEQPKVQVDAGALGTAIQVLREYRLSRAGQEWDAGEDAREAEYAIKKVMKRCGIPEPTAPHQVGARQEPTATNP